MKQVLQVSILLVLLVCEATLASSMQEIVVTGSRLSNDYDEMPAITIARKADFLVQNIRLINDSRSPELRRKEIISTIDNLLKASNKIKGIELSYGKGFLVPVNLNDDSLQIIEDRKRIDTSHVDIFVKVALNEKRSPKQQISELRSFISNTKLVSRTEIEARGDIGLSIVGPELYRYQILKKITVENEKIRSAIGGDCVIKISGLERRVQWDRTDITELTLYIGYATEMTCK